MLHSFGKNVLVFIPEYALKEVHTSQMIGTSQINASTAINKLCNTIEEVRLSFTFSLLICSLLISLDHPVKCNQGEYCTDNKHDNTDC